MKILRPLRNPILNRRQQMNQWLRRWIRNKSISIYKRVKEFFFPPLCLVCDFPKLPDNPWLCKSCDDKLRKNLSNRQYCPKCGQNKNVRSCTCDILWEHPFESIYSIFDFDDTIQQLMHHIKYFGKKKLAFDLGSMFSNQIPDSVFEGMDAIIPVPLHWYRKHRRGYNQSEWLARGIQLHRSIPLFTNVLIRKRYTRTQTKMVKEERGKNISGAFSVKPNKCPMIKDKSLLLIDDVITTGSTTGACTKALLDAGCKKVRVISLARD